MLKETYIPDSPDVKDAVMDKDQEGGKSQDSVSCVCVFLLFQYMLNLLGHFTLSQLQATISLLFHRMVIARIDMSPIMFGKIGHFVRTVQFYLFLQPIALQKVNY